MSTTADAKLPAIEHIKARKDGLDVLADIYRYAELGFDAIEPDDLALFRWYGIYTQRAEQSAASGDPGPSEDTDGYFMLRIKFPNGVVTADQLRAVGRLSERHGRGMGDITTRQNIQLHWLRIEDMPEIESDALLKTLFDHAERPEFVYRHAWRVGDLLVWDNRCSMHARDDFPSDQRRLMLRTTVKGAERPY